MRCRAANVVIMRTRPAFLRSLLLVLVLGSVVAAQDPLETIRIDSDLVDLKVSVLGFAANNPPPLLEPKDFLVLEDGITPQITFFAAADTPFDLVLRLHR